MRLGFAAASSGETMVHKTADAERHINTLQ